MKIHVLYLVSKSLKYAELYDVLDEYCHYYEYYKHRDIVSINTADITDTTDILTRGMHNSVHNPSDVWLDLLYSPFH